MSRRRFLAAGAGCAGYLAAAAPLLPRRALTLWNAGGGGRIVAQEPWARIEEVGPDMYAVVSTPLGGDYTTVCNGGIVGGSAETLVIEAFASPRGAAWVAARARELTGRWPERVVVSHYHSDHSAGPSGFGAADDQAAPLLHATEATRELVLTSPTNDAAVAPWADAVVAPDDAPLTLDLGDRTATVQPRRGHTASDLTVEVDGGHGPVWCGDLVWNAMFPNYRDAAPATLSQAVAEVRALPASTFVPGHGPLADAQAMARYAALLDSVERAAREAAREGLTAQEAAEAYETPDELGEWTMFNPAYPQRAIEAWIRELG